VKRRNERERDGNRGEEGTRGPACRLNGEDATDKTIKRSGDADLHHSEMKSKPSECGNRYGNEPGLLTTR
jgi:hypothetical protein